jgi:LPXTG-site transpeptidase (sortase) family protein
MNYRQLLKRGLLWLAPLALIIAGISYLALNQDAAASTPFIVPAPQLSGAGKQTIQEPVQLSIPAVAIQLSVKAGKFDEKTGQWSIDNTDAFFANSTTTPLIYGHNTSAVFEPLSRLTKNDRLILIFKDRSSKSFTYSGTRFIKPSDASVLTEEDPHTVILLTCSGIFSDLRRIVYFKET